jgi:probable rRNA maturation factor
MADDPGPPSSLSVAVSDDTTDGVEEPDRWARLAQSALRAEGVTVGHLDLLFVDAEPMAELNRSHMGHDGPTDVLSFPLDGVEADVDDDPFPAPVAANVDELPVHLGDVVICPTVAAAQAPAHSGSFDDEMALLVVHGVLHVLGHDHAEADEQLLMQRRERAILAANGLSHPVPEPTR